ncbi:hypothetical protein ACIBSR_24460 [Streptomyces sp. NPDC049936]|uniref:hypothetical protein n=1 Tax=Streptomyces sp. NPDC049936 TaxID=3365599 RepID=UPI0037916107
MLGAAGQLSAEHGGDGVELGADRVRGGWAKTVQIVAATVSATVECPGVVDACRGVVEAVNSG